MSVDAGESFRNGLRETFSARGIVVGLLLLVTAVANLFVQQSISRHVQEWLFGLITDGGVQQRELMAQTGTNLPFALDVGIPVLIASTFAFLLVNELIRLVGIRLFASESDEPIPVDDVAENFGSAAVKMLVLGGLLSLAVTLIGIVPIIGAVVSWVLLLLFVYLRQVIALEDESWFETVSRSIDLFTADPLPIAAVLFVLGLLGFLAAAGVPFVLGLAIIDNGGATATGSILENPQALTSLLGVVLGVIFQVLGIAAVTDAYRQARASAEEDPV